MARLVYCPTCGNAVSVNARKCPNCGENLERGRIIGENGLAPVGLLPLSIIQFLVFWIAPLFTIIYAAFGYVSFSTYLHFYIIFTIIAFASFFFAVRTANKSYRAYGVSIATAIISGFNTLGGGFMILFNYLQTIKK